MVTNLNRILYELGYISGVIEGADAAIYVKEQIQGAAARILEEITERETAVSGPGAEEIIRKLREDPTGEREAGIQEICANCKYARRISEKTWKCFGEKEPQEIKPTDTCGSWTNLLCWAKGS